MLAALGLVTPELVQKPSGFQGFQFAPEFSELNAIKALGSVPKLGLAQIALVIAFAEIATFNKVRTSMSVGWRQHGASSLRGWDGRGRVMDGFHGG